MRQFQKIQHIILKITGEEKECKAEELFELTMAENFPNLITNTKPHVQKNQ